MIDGCTEGVKCILEAARLVCLSETSIPSLTKFMLSGFHKCICLVSAVTIQRIDYCVK